MKKIINTTHTIEAAPGRVWDIISTGDGVDLWFPAITSCRLEGNGEGAKRICGSTAGDLYETIEKIDHTNRTFQYSINEQTMLPVTDMLATMIVKGEYNQTRLDWIFECTLLDESQDKVVQQTIQDLYAAGASGLEKAAQHS
ncbi:MAG: SRPBCC family protein [Chloroflexi bacterium AL-W]|nr:SRPBCC family protein [Chloroflexi bacterium AL-N1]NOK66446.1 SRPBCC family protein [Chloroflexi bacterium AL-N10]NOK71834.1 SRPBCC family protein [Chloroflexi bacterium AL-N5]NOK81091.1 SRPBCC family protein [Chloroflexi bacterium AL-W]NOK89364.1 SRPBCC family protein [Chloroflexi bacterium AL-N15]